MNKNHLFQDPKYRNLFLGFSGLLFVLFFALFYIIGLVPAELAYAPSVDEPVDSISETVSTETLSNSTKPVYVEIPSVGIKTQILRPQSVDVEILDQTLLKGAVYYPGSGTIENGNMLVFGHSTGLAVVQNQAFKTFNNLKKVQVGDDIYVQGEDGVTYVYKAISMELVTDSDALVSFDTTERMITLSTCNTFGKKQERHVVKAIFDRKE